MRVLVVSDVHSNLEALNAVLEDAGAFDMIWSLGDIVGYGPRPNECIARLHDYRHIAIPGNHDWGVLGKLDLNDFNTDARIANLWNREQLTAVSLAYLEGLAETRVEGNVTLAHGSPRHPIWEYLLYTNVARVSFDHFTTALCLVGHTHVPVIFRQAEAQGPVQALSHEEDAAVRLDDRRYIINPGSVGQPRDGDPRAAYMLLDPDEKILEHRRVAYNIEETQRQMREADLPLRNIARLELGW